MRKKQLAYVAAFCASLSIACAEVPELLELVPQAKGYELVYKLNPKNYAKEGYQVDNSESITGEVVKIGYLLKPPPKTAAKRGRLHLSTRSRKIWQKSEFPTTEAEQYKPT